MYVQIYERYTQAGHSIPRVGVRQAEICPRHIILIRYTMARESEITPLHGTLPQVGENHGSRGTVIISHGIFTERIRAINRRKPP